MQLQNEIDPNELPEQLRHESIIEAEDSTSSFGRAYTVTFDQTWMPYDYYRSSDGWHDDWRIDNARVTYQRIHRFLPVHKRCLEVTIRQRGWGDERHPELATEVEEKAETAVYSTLVASIAASVLKKVSEKDAEK